MKRFIKNITLIVFVSILSYPILICIWGLLTPQIFKPNLYYQKGTYGHLYSRIQDIPNHKNVDIMFLGSSHAYRGFDPRIFEAQGFTAFNLGSSGQTPINAHVLLKRYLEKIKPKLVIYEAFPGHFHSDGVESSLDIIASDRNDLESVKMVLNIGHLKSVNTLIYGLFSDVFNLDQDFSEPHKKFDDTYVKGGYVMKESKNFSPVEVEERNWTWNEDQFEALQKNINLIERSGASVILVKAPISSKMYEAFTDNEEFESLISKYGPFYDFNKLMNLDDSTNFYDSHHLNHSGVEIFNTKLLEVIPIAEYLEEN